MTLLNSMLNLSLFGLITSLKSYKIANYELGQFFIVITLAYFVLVKMSALLS